MPGRRSAPPGLRPPEVANGLKLTGEGGLLGRLTKMVIEGALEGELEDHLGYAKHGPEGRDGGNSRNGHRAKTVITDTGPVELSVPPDTRIWGDNRHDPMAKRHNPPGRRGRQWQGVAGGPDDGQEPGRRPHARHRRGKESAQRGSGPEAAGTDSFTAARPQSRIVSHPRAFCALIESGHRVSTRKPL